MNSPWTTQLALNPMAHDFIRKNSRAIGHRREVSETEGGKLWKAEAGTAGTQPQECQQPQKLEEGRNRVSSRALQLP